MAAHDPTRKDSWKACGEKCFIKPYLPKIKKEYNFISTLAWGVTLNLH
jgi:uncharacterized protein YozE (UPF0346 family)